MPARKKSKIGRRKKAGKQRAKVRDLLIDPVDSDNLLAESLLGTFFLSELETQVVAVSREHTDSDGFSADEFYVVLDKPYKYCPDDDLDDLVYDQKSRLFSELRESCRQNIADSNFVYIINSVDIQYIQLYDSDECSVVPRVKACIAVSQKLDVKIMVHGKEIPSNHVIWENVGRSCFTVNGVQNVLSEFANYKVCTGNQDNDLQELIPVGAFMHVADNSYHGYWEGHYIGSTIRSTKCNMIIQQRSSRCEPCQVYRRTLMKTLARRKIVPKVTTPQKNWMKSRTSNNKLSQCEKFQKIKQLKTYSQDLEGEVAKLRREIKRKISCDGITLSASESTNMIKIMETNENEVKRSYPNEMCFF